MCWQDIQIGRAKTVRSSTYIQPSGPNSLLFDTYYRRVSLNITGTDQAQANGLITILIGTGNNPNSVSSIIAEQDIINPFIFDVKDWGQVLQGQLWVSVSSASGFGQVWVTEMELSDPASLGNPVSFPQ